MSKSGVAEAAARTPALMLSETHHLLLCACRGAICISAKTLRRSFIPNEWIVYTEHTAQPPSLSYRGYNSRHSVYWLSRCMSYSSIH